MTLLIALLISLSETTLEAQVGSGCSLPAMRGMVLAAGLGTRLRPLTWDVSKPMVPVANRPIMEHVLQLLARNDLNEVIANLHWYGDSIRNAFGDGSGLRIAPP